jgi:hypothetical protein
MDSSSSFVARPKRRAIASGVLAMIAAIAAFVGVPAPASATDAPAYTAYVGYASAPQEVLGKTASGWKVLSAAEAAAVPRTSIAYRSGTQFLKVAVDGKLYKVSGETVSALSMQQWSYEGSPTPRIVDRTPAMEYYTYASAPDEILVRTPVGTWRHASDAEDATVPASVITRRANTYFLRAVGDSQVVKKVNGMTTPISDAQWRGEGSPTPMVPEVGEVGRNPFLAGTPYVDPTYPSVAAAAALRASGDEASAAQVDKISRYGGTMWVGDWNPVAKVRGTVARYASAAAAAGQTGVLVVYGIPGRDCTGYSAGGFTAAEYDNWIDEIAAGLWGQRIAVVLEPDALLQLGRCPDLQGDRTGLLRYATSALSTAGATVYIDAGSSNSVSAADMAARLSLAGVAEARGFSSNVSNYKTIGEARAYADEVSRLLGGKKYVIDTSRNGNGSNGDWCNARGRALGAAPGASDYGNQDANLWIKTIGSSDGTCNGGPAAGHWWNEIAVELAANSQY